MTTALSTRRIVVSGLGVVSSAGIGADRFWHRVIVDRPGDDHVEIDRADVAAQLTIRGTSHWSPAGKFAAVAATQAWAASGLDRSDGIRRGTVLATSLGSVESMSRFDDEIASVGARAVDPRIFTNTVHNHATGLIGILQATTGLNTTVSAGCASTADALDYAIRCLRGGSADVMVVGGVDERSRVVEKEFERHGVLAKTLAQARPFSRASDGIAPGEGAAVFVLETLDHLRRRGGRALAEIRGLGRRFVFPTTSEADVIERQMTAMCEALAGAALAPRDVGYVEASANGLVAMDGRESQSLLRMFYGGGTPVAALKGRIGECFGASDALQIARAVGALARGRVPATPRAPDDQLMIGGTLDAPEPAQFSAVLVNAFNPVGLQASVVIAQLDSDEVRPDGPTAHV